MTEIAYANQEQMFAVLETTAGQLKKPAASNRMYSVGPVDFGQEGEFLEDEQIRETASQLPSILGRTMPGEFSFDTYVKPNGTPGQKPEHAALFEALMGAETEYGNRVEYTLALEVPSLSVWVKKGHTAYAFRGATIEGAGFGIAGDAISLISWSGKYMRQIQAGTAYTTKVTGTVLTMEPGGALRYNEGAFIKVGSDNNGGAGFKILNIQPTINKMTLNGSPSVAGVRLVTPWWPSVGTEYGKPGHGKLGIVRVGGTQCIVLSANVNMVNNIKYYIDEKNDVMTAERYGRPTKREIDGTLALYFTKAGASYAYKAEYQVNDELIIPVGKKDGYIMELQIPKAEYRTPKLSGDEEFQEDIPFKAVASSGNLDSELKIVFK